MHIQNRDFPQFQKSSNKLLMAKPDNKAHWMGFAVACHLNGDHHKTISILDQFIAAMQKKDLLTDSFEKSELLFFKANVLEQAQGVSEALTFLKTNESLITDKEEWFESVADYSRKLGLKDEEIATWKTLLNGNPENFNYHRGLLIALDIIPSDHPTLFKNLKLSEDKIVKLVELYDELKKSYPLARACRQIPFAFLDIPRFRVQFGNFVGPAFSKGTVSIFNCVKYLYADPEKAKAMEEVMLEFKDLLESDKPLPGQTLLEPPSSLLFCYYYLSQHYNVVKKTKEALEYCDKCIKHTPTQVDFYVLKARIYKDAKDFAEGAKWMEEARTMDLADRWLNTKATLYFLRADQVENAEKTISIFTKVECIDKEQNYNNILDMQVMWYEQEEGESWVRQRKYGKALKRFGDVIKHFNEFWSDQMDFHQYCAKKVTLRQYIRFLKMEDQLSGHKFYVKAACSLIKCYLDIDRNPSLGEPEKVDEKQVTKKTPKKGLDKQHDGEDLLGLGLNEANKYLKNLTKFAPNHAETHLLAVHVSLRRKKYLLALRALNKLIVLDPLNPVVKELAKELFGVVGPLKESWSETVRGVFNTQETKICQQLHLAK